MADADSPPNVLVKKSKSEEASMKKPEIPLLSGEEIVYTIPKGVSHVCPVYGLTPGKLFVTNFKLFFKGYSSSKKFFVRVPLCTISHAEKVGGASTARVGDGKNPYGIDIVCKDLRTLRFTMNQENKQRRVFLDKLQEYCYPASHKRPFFAYIFKEDFRGRSEGWNVYNPNKEFSRQGFPLDYWRFTDINEEYEFCDTYPKALVVPTSVTDEDLKQVVLFRSRGRIPVLSWIHRHNKASITRCSQPLTGVRKRNRDDERYIQKILDANPNCKKLLIIDARPQANAIANMARGGGYERSEYTMADLMFCDIQNIHVMRDSLKKVQDACNQLTHDDKYWLTNLDDSKWFHHAKCILSAAIQIVNCVETLKTSVVVHCSDGWDRTAQLTGLAMIMLDSYYRTIEGFQVLIEKEWLSFGHKFAQRIGHGDKNHSDSERSPVFLQFIDCVFQIFKQLPTAFEFNEDFLILILDHLYSCLFGNFLYNNERERNKEQKVQEKSQSLWSFVAANRDEYLNPLYVTSFKNRVILPIAAIRHFTFWSTYFLRHNPKHKPQDPFFVRERELVRVRDALKKRVEELERQVAEKHGNSPTAKTTPVKQSHAKSPPSKTAPAKPPPPKTPPAKTLPPKTPAAKVADV